MVLDGTTGLNMLQQAREFNEVFAPLPSIHSFFSNNLCSQQISCSKLIQIFEYMDYISLQVVGVTGFILTKLDGTARGGCVVSSPKPLAVLLQSLLTFR